MPPAIRNRVTLVTHNGRADMLRKAQPGAHVLDIGKPDGIAAVRQAILDHYLLIEGEDKLFMIDDGCKFYRSWNEMKDGEKVRKVSSTWIRDVNAVDEWDEMINGVDALLDKYPQVGISARPGNNRHVEALHVPGRSYSCYGLNLRWLADEGIRFDDMYRKNPAIKLYEDFYLTLSLLTRGIPNAVWYEFAFQHQHGKKGGNAEIRTNDLQRVCLEALESEFPDYVKLYKRDAISWNVGEDPYRWECRVQWKKALQQSTQELL